MSSKKRRRPRGHTPPFWKVRERVALAEHDRLMAEAFADIDSAERAFARAADREMAPLAAESVMEVES